METYSCENHIDKALDDFIEKQEVFPIMEKVVDKNKLSTKCDSCDNLSLYVVANKQSTTTY